MAATASGELTLIREELRRHEDRDEQIFSEMRDDLKAHAEDISSIRQIIANMTGRMTVLGAAAILLIPVLTGLVNAFFAAHPARP